MQKKIIIFEDGTTGIAQGNIHLSRAVKETIDLPDDIVSDEDMEKFANNPKKFKKDIDKLIEKGKKHPINKLKKDKKAGTITNRERLLSNTEKAAAY